MRLYFLFRLGLIYKIFNNEFLKISGGKFSDNSFEFIKIPYSKVLEIYYSYIIQDKELSDIVRNWEYDRDRIRIHPATKWLLNMLFTLTYREGLQNFIKNKNTFKRLKKIYEDS